MSEKLNHLTSLMADRTESSPPRSELRECPAPFILLLVFLMLFAPIFIN
ncbi:hypothetical protein SAMN05660964_01115 [Thiothrix caldifontis]|uniref:Uncharacterized protein n=1 Tax=Thiothrix caldifontis TaxID=525918 RepID=A0A1H3ZAP4_9GAMM|nr:hypothetical protein [Thiothrix caldifontis]SEA20826.1 hypothetical protein SAMN05660964_01115 [Thiothrix caldifontis]